MRKRPAASVSMRRVVVAMKVDRKPVTDAMKARRLLKRPSGGSSLPPRKMARTTMAMRAPRSRTPSPMKVRTTNLPPFDYKKMSSVLGKEMSKVVASSTSIDYKKMATVMGKELTKVVTTAVKKVAPRDGGASAPSPKTGILRLPMKAMKKANEEGSLGGADGSESESDTPVFGSDWLETPTHMKKISIHCRPENLPIPVEFRIDSQGLSCQALIDVVSCEIPGKHGMRCRGKVLQSSSKLSLRALQHLQGDDSEGCLSLHICNLQKGYCQSDDEKESTLHASQVRPRHHNDGIKDFVVWSKNKSISIHDDEGKTLLADLDRPGKSKGQALGGPQAIEAVLSRLKVIVGNADESETGLAEKLKGLAADLVRPKQELNERGGQKSGKGVGVSGVSRKQFAAMVQKRAAMYELPGEGASIVDPATPPLHPDLKALASLMKRRNKWAGIEDEDVDSSDDDSLRPSSRIPNFLEMSEKTPDKCRNR